MSYKLVKYYRDLEDYNTAYMIACEDWSENPKLKWPRNTIAWLLIKMMKNRANAYSQKRFLADLPDIPIALSESGRTPGLRLPRRLSASIIGI